MPEPGTHVDHERFRPLRIWRSLDPERRARAAAAFWKSDSVKDADRAAAVAALAQTLKFRPDTIRTTPAAKKASYLAGFAGMTDHLASALLYAYHLETQVTMLSRFLDLLGIAQENGRITGETDTPERKAVEDAAGTLFKEFDARDVTIYLETLLSQDDDTWGTLARILEARAIR